MRAVRTYWQEHKAEILWAAIFAIPAAYFYEWAYHGFSVDTTWIKTMANYRIPIWYDIVALVVLLLIFNAFRKFSSEKHKFFTSVRTDHNLSLESQPAQSASPKNVSNSSVLVEGGVHVSAGNGSVAIGVNLGEIRIGLTEDELRKQLESTVITITAQILEATKMNDADTVRRLTLEIDIANSRLADMSGTLANREAELRAAYQQLERLKDQLPAEQAQRAKSLLLQGKVELAEELFDTIVQQGASHVPIAAFQSGQLAEGRFEYFKAYDSYRTAAALDKNAPFWLAVGRVANVLGKFDEAAQFLAPLLNQFRNDESKDSKLLLAQVTNELAIAYKEVHRFDDAERLYSESLDVIEPLTGRIHPEIAVRLNNLAQILSSKGQYDKAESMFLDAIKIISTTSGIASPQIGAIQVNLAQIYIRTGKFDKANELLKKAENLFAQSPNKLALSSVINTRGELYRELGRLEEAVELFQKAQQLKSNILGSDHLDVATILNNIALAYEEMGKYDEVEAMHQRVLNIRKAHLGDNHPLVANTLNNIAWFLLRTHRNKEAIEVGQEALTIRERALGPCHPDTANTLNGLGAAHMNLHEFDKAEIYFKRALSIKAMALGPDSHEALPIMSNLGLLYSTTGKLQSALDILSRSLHLSEKFYGINGFKLVPSLVVLGAVSKKTGNHAQADKYYDRALDIVHKHFPMGHPYIRDISSNRNQ